MRFCDKLSKLRKQNNITQEQLADRLEISRQAVSKWESGTSIPDMEKMIELCNILNCTLEDLLDDGVIGDTKSLNNKGTPINYFQDFLKYISKIYNMFCSMKFKEKLKCLFEMFVVFVILFSLGFLIDLVGNYFLNNIFGLIPKIGYYIANFLNSILIIALIILGLIIFFHLFKIRYLDYYLIIEDKNISKKVIEKPIEEEKTNEYVAPKKEKIIIRDPKHSTFSFFEFLSKVFFYILKIFMFFILAFLIMILAGFLIIFFITVWHVRNGTFFLYILLAIFGILLFIYSFIEVFYIFIISSKQHFKRVFIMGIIGIIIFSFGTGFSIATYLNFEPYDIEKDGTIETETIEMQDNLILDTSMDYIDYDDFKYNYVIDDSKENKIEFRVRSYGNFKLNLDYCYFEERDQKYYEITIYLDRNAKDIYNLLIQTIKEKKSLLNLEDTPEQVTVTLSKESYQKLLLNKKNINS